MKPQGAVRAKVLVSAGAVLLLILHWLPSRFNFDLTTWILVGLCALPWVFQFIHTAEVAGLKLEFRDQVRDIKSKQEEQRQELDRLKIIVNLLVTDDEFRHLQRFVSPEPWLFQKDSYTNKYFEQELRRLRALGLITGQKNKGVRSLFKEGGDVKNHFRITEEGVKFIAFRNQVNEPPPDANQNG